MAFKEEALKDFVVIKPDWIYTHLVSFIMSEHPLPKPYVQYKNGYAKLSDVVDLLKTAHPDISGEKAVQMLSELGFMIVLDHEDKALVPVKLKEQRPEKYWPKIPRDIIRDMVFGGRRHRFVGIVGPSSALFPLTQSRFYRLFLDKYNTEVPLWANGIRVTSGKYSGAVAIIEAHPDLRCIDVIVRSLLKYADHCQRLLHNLCHELTVMMVQLSPGSTMQVFFLSRGELALQSESGSLSPPEVQYTEERVRHALEANEQVTDGHGSDPEDPGCLMISDEEFQRKRIC